MRVTLLGTGAAYARAGSACSGLLVQAEGATVMVDAGNGTLSNLLRHVSHRDLDAVFVTHRHADHRADLIPLMYARGFDTEPQPKIPLYAPEDVVPAVLAGHSAFVTDLFHQVYEPRPLGPTTDAGSLRVQTFPTLHPVPTFGVRLSDGGPHLVYTSDTAFHPELPGACKDAAVLVSEATYVRGRDGAPDTHMQATEAGRLATESGAARLVLTHVWPDISLEQSVREASESYAGFVEAGAEGAAYEL